MGYLDRILSDGETVCVDVRPHWWFLVGPVAAVVVTAAATVALVVTSQPEWSVWLVLALTVLALVWLIGRYLRWVTTRLVVTSDRVIERRGVLARQGREIPLAALSDISYHQSIFERVIGAGNVVLESAGRDSAEVFPDLPHPGQIHNEIYLQLERIRRGGAVSTASPASIPDQIDQLDQLRRRGVITEEEFQAKKAQLLDRL